MQYKLKKEYPGSPKLGTIIDNSNGFIDAIKPQNYSEFWEEIINEFSIICIKGLGEVTLYYNKDGICILRGDTLNPSFTYKLQDIFKINTNYYIHSVKRSFDGEIFTIGDKIKLRIDWNDNCFLNKIDFENGKIVFTVKQNSSIAKYSNTNFDKWIKIKPSFKTKDGVNVDENDIVYLVDKKSPTFYISHKFNMKCSRFFLVFKIEKNAMDYINLNKKQFSKQDFIDLLKDSNS